MLLDLFRRRAPSTQVAPGDALLSREECRTIAQRAFRLQTGRGELRVGIHNAWRGDARWARNRLTTAGDRRDVSVTLQRRYGLGGRELTTSRTDEAGLAEAMAELEILLRDNGTAPLTDKMPPRRTDFPSPTMWSEATVRFPPEGRAELAARVIQPAAEAGLWSAGYLAVGAQADCWIGTDGEDLYATQSLSECSLTVRDPKGGGSGWAGLSSYDWTTVDPVALAERARQKCEASRLPSALEPGRYTVVLEPQAVGDLLEVVLGPLDREPAEAGQGPYADPARPGFSRLGQRLIDPRIDITFDPADPLLGVCPFNEHGEPMVRAPWFEHGVLTALAYSRFYGVTRFNQNRALPYTEAARMSGGEATVEEMIRSTKRGLLVTRFSGVTTIDEASLLSTGHTRDGLWLIENGKVTRPVKNFRFTDSPLLMLNGVEAMGRPVPIFRPRAPLVVPPLKATSFNFTRLVDAV